MFPDADQIALAIVTACRLTGEDPFALIEGERGHKARARQIALAALIEVFPDARRTGLARCVACSSPHSAVSNLNKLRGLKWWREDWVDEVVGVLVGGDYGEEQSLVRSGPPAHFDAAERKLIASMVRGGANPVAIGAAIGSDADTIRMFINANPQLRGASQPERTNR